jgi:hypothetical protein
MSVVSRYRERVPPQEKGFFGLMKPAPGQNMPIIGVFNEYFASGNLFNSTNIRLTGLPPDSFAIERCWDELHPGPPYRKGGPFSKISIVIPSAQVRGGGTYASSDGRKKYIGSFIPSISTVAPTYESYVSWGNASAANSAFPDITAYHNKAWDLLLPKVEKAGTSQFLYELRDLPGMLKTTSRGFHDVWSSMGGREGLPVMHPKSVADHFLNHQFGWVPFVNDLIKFYDAYQRSDEYIARITRDNGRWVKRKVMVDKLFSDVLLRRDYDPMLSPTGENMNQISSQRQIDGIPCWGFCDTRLQSETTVWAEGSFTYYRPEFDPSLLGFSSRWSNTKRLLDLYGARINPSVLWKITPWSWLIDWFTSLGRNIQIATAWAQDSVASKYAYIMRSDSETVRQSHIRFFQSGPLFISWDRSRVIKQRVDAGSPYGFNLSWDHLSPTQFAILGAIGISRFNFG